MIRPPGIHFLSQMICILILSLPVIANTDMQADASDNYYGVDISFPIHHEEIQDRDNPLNSEAKRKFYNDFLDGCKAKYSSRPRTCINNERDRIEMNLHQPMSMFVSIIIVGSIFYLLKLLISSCCLL
jgi:hypothetical protein